MMMPRKTWAVNKTRTSAVNHQGVVDRLVSKVANMLVVSRARPEANKEREIWKTMRILTLVVPADKIAAPRIAADRIAN